ncbi:MAG: ferritin-like domain-containing protein [Acidobacteria bacterium]|nr:ferritin-like domain-containing protein [Acidobacteriota bacterium]
MNRETIEIRGFTLRKDPAREECFTVVHRDVDMHEYADMSLVARQERLHRHMNNEIGGIEIAAQMLVDFPDAPWELRMELARQCWDETRHVELLHRRLVELGGHKGQFPISNFEWCVTNLLDHIAARLALQNRTLEAGQMDILGKITRAWREVGDDETARVLEGILADEIQHVRFANQWIRRMVEKDRRVLLAVANAMVTLRRANDALAPEPGEVNKVGVPVSNPNNKTLDVNITDRKIADFTDEEIEVVLRQAGFKSIAPTDKGAGATA